MPCEFTIESLRAAVCGETLSTHGTEFTGVSTDSRHIDGQIFFALVGEKFDAHDYLSQAVLGGAKCLIVHRETPELNELKSQVTVVRVADTLRALQELARDWRHRLEAKVFGVTGSNGKSSTKEFAATILGTQFKVCVSHGSFNNHWGVPLTLLSASRGDDVVLVEMGMNHSGELTQLSKIAEPDVVLCTTVGRAHIGNFGGDQQKVADAKEEIYLANPGAIKIFNTDNEYTMKMFDRVAKRQGPERTLAFSSFSAGAEVGFRADRMQMSGLHVVGHIKGVKGEATVPVFGRHNVVNLMAAASLALVMGMEPEKIWQALSLCRGQWGRNQLVKLPNGTTVIFDAYNANPDSVSMLVRNFFEMSLEAGVKKVAIFGQMLELGADSPRYHEELGELVGQSDIAVVWFFGDDNAAFERGLKRSGFSKTYFISNGYEESLAMKVRSMLNPKDIVVMKGSRGMRLERVLLAWDPSFQPLKK